MGTEDLGPGREPSTYADLFLSSSKSQSWKGVYSHLQHFQTIHSGNKNRR